MKRLIYTLISLLLSFSYCTKNPTNFVESLTVDIPLYKKTVNAFALYVDYGQKDSLEFLRVSSMIFDSSYYSNDTLYFKGIYEYIEPIQDIGPFTGEIILAFTDNWVLYQRSNIYYAIYNFLKPNVITLADTTNLPTVLFNQVPIFPRVLSPNETYFIYRPGNLIPGGGFGDFSREFKVGNRALWKDAYDVDFGFEVIIEHKIMEFTITYDCMIDENGLINYQFKSKVSHTINQTDDLQGYLINRRIVNYRDPSSILDLSYYAEMVINNGLKYSK